MPRGSAHRPRGGQFGMKRPPKRYIHIGVWGYRLREYTVNFVQRPVQPATERPSRIYYEEPTLVRVIEDSLTRPKQRVLEVYIESRIMICRHNDGKAWISYRKVPWHARKRHLQGKQIRARKTAYRQEQIRKRKADYPSF